MALRGSSSSAPAPLAVEHGHVLEIQKANKRPGKEILTDGADLPSPTPPTQNFNLNLSQKSNYGQSDFSENTEPNISLAQTLTSLGRPNSKKGIPVINSLGRESNIDQQKRSSLAKRPAELSALSAPVKRSLEQALTTSDSHLNEPNTLKVYTKKTAPEAAEGNSSPPRPTGEVRSPVQHGVVAPILRRSTRQAKGNANLSSFVVGSSARKPRAPKLKPDAVKEALVAAELERCLDTYSLVTEPLTEDEQLKIKQFCGILEPAAQVGTEATNPLDTTTDNMESGLEEEGLGERFSGLDDSMSDDFTDLDVDTEGA